MSWVLGLLVLLCYRQALSPCLFRSASYSQGFTYRHMRVNECTSILYLYPFIIIAAPTFLSFVCMDCLFLTLTLTLTFSRFVSLALKEVSYKQHVDGSFFYLVSRPVFFLVTFSLLTFEGITDSCVLTATLLLVFC